MLSIETIGAERFIRGFSRIEASFKDLSEVFEILYDDFKLIEMQNFAHEGTPKEFTPLSPKYAEWKAMNYPGQKIMRLTDRLYKSLTGSGGGDTVHIVKKDEATFGTSVPYAHRHQVGFDMPKRMIVQLTENNKIRWGRLVHGWGVKKIREALQKQFVGSNAPVSSFLSRIKR